MRYRVAPSRVGGSEASRREIFFWKFPFKMSAFKMSNDAVNVQMLGHDFFTVYFYRPCKLRLCTVLIFLPSYTTLLHVDWRGQAPTPLMQPFQPLLSVFLGFLKFFAESFFFSGNYYNNFPEKNVQGDVDPRFHCGICEMWTSKKTSFLVFLYTSLLM